MNGKKDEKDIANIVVQYGIYHSIQNGESFCRSFFLFCCFFFYHYWQKLVPLAIREKASVLSHNAISESERNHSVLHALSSYFAAKYFVKVLSEVTKYEQFRGNRRWSSLTEKTECIQVTWSSQRMPI